MSRISLTPLGDLVAQAEPAAETPESALPAGLGVEDAFGVGSGFGLMQLAGACPAVPLPAVESYWRDFARTLLTREIAEGPLPLALSEAETWLAGAPLMPGGEYLTPQTLIGLAGAISTAAQNLCAQSGGKSLQDLLTALNPAWDAVARVCLSLAENRADPARPFAMLATYTTHIAGAAKPRHTPLAQALKEQVTAGEKAKLEKLTGVLAGAAKASPLVQDWLSSRRIFQPQALNVAEAYRFLQEVGPMEAAGLMVRLPNWWDRTNPPKPRVTVTVGGGKPKGSGLGAPLDFKIELTLNGQVLTKEEWQALRQAVSGLVFLRGQWVAAEPEKIQQALDAWRQSEALAARGGLSFAQAMRLVVGAGLREAGAAGGAGANVPGATTGLIDSDLRQWSDVVAGDWLQAATAALSHPETAKPPPLGDGLRAELRRYQQVGLSWLWRLHTLGLGGCLADDMGLGKTVQVLAFFVALKKAGTNPLPHLIVAPATLVSTWLAEAAKFAPGLRFYAAHPSQRPAAELKSGPRDIAAYDVVVTSYGSLLRYEWLKAIDFGVAVLDEAQSIKNPDARQTQAAKLVKARQRIALTGTPVENQPLDLWSIFDFINPGLLGSAKQFAEFLKKEPTPGAPSSFAALRSLIRPYILRRLKTDKALLPDLPDKTEMDVSCGLVPAQAVIYERIVDELRRDLALADGMRRRGVVLAALLKLKQVCNHPSLATGHGDFSRDSSGKLQRLRELAEEIAARQEKLLVFTQFREMTGVLDRELAEVFGRPGCVLHGETPLKERQRLVKLFQGESQTTASGNPPYFVLSLKAGGTGLTLTAAAHVIHFDRWWNPAVEDQATDRAYRIGQKRNVLVHKFACAGTVEAKVADLIATKRGVARELLSGGNEAALTELKDEELLALVALDINSASISG